MIKYFIVQQAVKEIYLNCQNSDKKLKKKFYNKNQPKTSEQSKG